LLLWLDIPRYQDSYFLNVDVQQGFAFLLIVILYQELRELSWLLYNQFVIQELSGFNKMSIGLFFKDILIKYMIVLVFATPVYLIAMGLIYWGGEYFYMYLMIFYLVFIVVFMNIVPTFIMPLFNKYEDIPAGELKDKIHAMA
jgi:STE24 endopeptidase